jgi:hypothetical protein
MWFTFLIQQPAFVLGFAIVSSILGSLLKAHGGSIGTLFLFSGSLIFLGGVNILVGKIFGDGWSLVTANYQSMVAGSTINRFNISSLNEIKRGAVTGRPSSIRSYAGYYIGKKIGLLPNTNDKKVKDEMKKENNPKVRSLSKNQYGYAKVYKQQNNPEQEADV